jgi:hypothetical protein
MADAAVHAQAVTGARLARPDLERGLHPSTAFSGTRHHDVLPYLLLFIALLIACPTK